MGPVYQGKKVEDWVSGEGRRIEKGETIGLRLQHGSLIAYVRGKEIGVLKKGLRGWFVWAADLRESGTAVHIMGKPPPL